MPSTKPIRRTEREDSIGDGWKTPFASGASRKQSIVVRQYIRGWHRIAGLIVALAVVSTPALLFAHARLLRMVPAANARLAQPPAKLSLWFSERPEPQFTSIQLTDATGAKIPLGPVMPIDSMGVAAAVGPMKAGPTRCGKNRRAIRRLGRTIFTAPPCAAVISTRDAGPNRSRTRSSDRIRQRRSRARCAGRSSWRS